MGIFSKRKISYIFFLYGLILLGCSKKVNPIYEQTTIPGPQVNVTISSTVTNSPDPYRNELTQVTLPTKISTTLPTTIKMSPIQKKEEFSEVFEQLWSVLDKNYPYFDYKDIDWHYLHDIYKLKVSEASDNREFNLIMVNMLSNLKDEHVIFHPPDMYPMATFKPTHETNIPRDVLIHNINKYQLNTEEGIIYGKISDIPYIAIQEWDESHYNQDSFDAILEQYKNETHLIIDVRMNGGGRSDFAYGAASRFTEIPRITDIVKYRNGPNHSDFTSPITNTLEPRGSWQYKGQVVVLIGAQCLSSNEQFIAAMQTIPSVTTIGDTTGGSSGNPKYFPLYNGWGVTASTWLNYTPDNRMIEGKGLSPTISIKVAAHDFQNSDDPILNHAVSWLLKKHT